MKIEKKQIIGCINLELMDYWTGRNSAWSDYRVHGKLTVCMLASLC